MKRMRRFMRFALVGAIALLFAGFVAPTNGLAIDFLLTSDHCTGTCGTPPFGTVSVNQVATNVNIVVTLAAGIQYAQTGAADFQLFKFNGVGVAVTDIVVGAHVPALQANTGVFNGDGTGPFSFGISCPSCGTGPVGFGGAISFTVNNAFVAELTQPNSLGNVFVADILGLNGNTGPVAVTGVPPVPEPSTVLLSGLGVAMLIVGHKWRKHSLVRNGGNS
jgi:hypothetical protein